jgi:ubiquinol-cytochrome c reductase cytochrome b/c1 subunit
MGYVSYRNLGEPGGPGFSPAEVAAIAAGFQVQDGPDDAGDMFDRPALPRDRLASPFANDNAARAANGGALPPDLSVIAKARGIERSFPWWLIDLFNGYQEQGADYIHAVLTGYGEAPAEMAMQPGMSYNRYFPGHQIAMPAPLSDGMVEYADGTETSVDQMASDVASFLMWAAEPHLVERKRIGFQVMIFLGVFAGLLYLTKKKIWARVEH